MDQYHISSIPQRFLMTQHYHSSIDEPNLDNVQAKLNATRQKNHQLALSYFRNKYGSAQAYQQFAKNHNMGEVTPNPYPSSQQILKSHLQRKARQIQKQFYNQQQFQTDHQHQHIQQPQWIHKNRNKGPSDTNPWVKVSKPQQQKHQKNTSSQKYIDSVKSPKNKQRQFLNNFKHFLQQKQQQKQLEKQKQFNESMMKKTGKSIFQGSKIMGKSIPVQEQNQSKKKCYQQQLAKKIFKDIVGQSKNQTKIQKLTLVEYIVNNKKILKVLGFTQQQLNNKLMGQQKTKSQSEITLQQFVFFILKSVGKQKQINNIKQQRRQKSIPQGCMLTKQIISHFQKVFQQLDKHTDLIIKRLPYIQRLANDPLIKNQLNSPAVYEPDLAKAITLRRVFQRIEMECLFGTQQQQKVKQYISWNQFLDYFKSSSSHQSTYDIVSLIDSLHKSDQFGMIEVPEMIIKVIADSASTLPIKSGCFNVLSLIQNISKHPQYDVQKYAQVREQSKLANLPSQTFQQVLTRIKQKGQKFMTLKQFLEYFSSKGKPLQDFQQAKIATNKKNFSGVKIKFAQQEIVQNRENLDGYDSDPQIYQSKILNKNSPRRTGRSSQKLQHANSILQDSKGKPIYRNQFKVTVPIPFKFQQRQKQRNKKKEQEQQQKQTKKQNEHFKAKPIPSKVLQQGLYYKMLQQDRKRIQQRKKSCMIMTLANQQPFQFMKRKTNKKTKHERQQFVFKAKPIPWYCSVDLLQKKKQAQIVRNQKIAKQAQQNLAKAKLPPRMQRDFQQKQAKMALIQQDKAKKTQSKPKVYRQPPDFDKLHRQFEQGLERKRKQNKTTQPQQFNFNNRGNSRPKTAVPNQTHQQFYNQGQTKIKDDNYKKIFNQAPAATSTAKFQQQVEKRREQMQKKRKQQQEKRLEDQKRKKIDQNLKAKLLLVTQNKVQKEQRQRKQKVDQMKVQNENFKQWKKERIEKGRNQPMLVQRPLKRDQKIQKMKKLYQISQTLKSNNIKGKDHDSYFNRQQLLLLQDWQHLKDKIV